MAVDSADELFRPIWPRGSLHRREEKHPMSLREHRGRAVRRGESDRKQEPDEKELLDSAERGDWKKRQTCPATGESYVEPPHIGYFECFDPGW